MDSQDSTSSRLDRSRSVERALHILEVVAEEAGGLSLSDVSRAVDVPTSTTSRMLHTLESNRFVSRTDTGRYVAGSRLLQIGAVSLGNSTLHSVAREHLQALADFSGETAYLAIPEGRDTAVYVGQVESPRAIRHASWAGRSIPTSGTAVGKALSDELGAEGYAVSRRTAVEPEATAAAAPVRDAAGAVIGALSIIAPSFRVSDQQLRSFGEAVRYHASEVSATLGFVLSSGQTSKS